MCENGQIRGRDRPRSVPVHESGPVWPGLALRTARLRTLLSATCCGRLVPDTSSVKRINIYQLLYNMYNMYYIYRLSVIGYRLSVIGGPGLALRTARLRTLFSGTLWTSRTRYFFGERINIYQLLCNVHNIYWLLVIGQRLSVIGGPLALPTPCRLRLTIRVATAVP